MADSNKPETGTASPMEQFSSFVRGLKLPSVEVNEILASQKKNVEAFTKAMHAATEGAGAVARRQTEILRSALEQTTEMIRELAVPENPKETVARQVELAKKAFETATANARAFAETVEKSNLAAFEALRQRTSETLEEIRKALLKKKTD